jgi:hypothetical protein
MRMMTSLHSSEGKEFEVRGNFTCLSVGVVCCEVCRHIVYIGKFQKYLMEKLYGHEL